MAEKVIIPGNMEKEKLAIASDHAGYHLKEDLKQFLGELGYHVWDFGTHSEDSVDYPILPIRWHKRSRMANIVLDSCLRKRNGYR